MLYCLNTEIIRIRNTRKIDEHKGHTLDLIRLFRLLKKNLFIPSVLNHPIMQRPLDLLQVLTD